MNTKMLALMLLAGGSMFAQTRFAGHWNLPETSSSPGAPRYERRDSDYRYDDDHARLNFNRNSDQDRNEGSQQYRDENRSSDNDRIVNRGRTDGGDNRESISHSYQFRSR